MSKNVQKEIERIKSELAGNRYIIERNNESLADDRWLHKQILFWMESTRFLVTELEIWNRTGNDKKCAETTLKAQKALDTLDELFEQLD